MGSVRWAFRCKSWTPSRSDWLFAARCVQPEEKERIGQFVFTKDAKSAMVGRLLLRRFVCERMGIPWTEIRLERSPRGKPYLADTPKISPHCDRSWSFNISHQGDYVVLAADRGVQVGVDLMKVSMPGSSSVPEFFRIMTRQFTPHEWSVIQSAGSEREQLATFHRHWTLKESFIKAIGTGLGFNLQRVEFHLSPEPLRPGSVLRQTKMLLDEEPEEAWIFESLASWLAPPPPPPSPFTLLSFSELIASASPLTEEDPAYWESFRMKAEAPQRRREAQASA
ncbi:L-aminoadipate-semialdehyde dehydrogenase-phosphopantetheinyl transferase [Oryzias melastigma]|uniref:L-aminoadipate-semialdehyde dehydrogenase-phosphopantetheinyl transferase n=1 Tax=Oryzias melastigma TaxID=30732 RepID=A0A834F4G6_ORYME|nr:L-aminoadipate-semialdehyde dehydrogenase-phosphopantetheinyl transferase [Oryzias melastigma]